MRPVIILLFTLLIVVCSLPYTAKADQAQDWYVGPQEEGPSSELTVFFPGVMSTLDHRIDIYSGNQLLLQTGGIVTYPLGNLWVGADLRFLLFSIGGKVGFQDTWRNITFEEDEELSRHTLRERSAAGEFDNTIWPYIEGRTTMAVPFNKYVLLLTEFTSSYKNMPDRTYDWLASIIHDKGMLYTWDTTLFFKHKSFGAVGPVVQVVDFGLDNVRHTQINYGFTLLSRAGLVRRNDFIVWQMKFHHGNEFVGGYDNSDVYGFFTYRAPFDITIAYRAKIDL